MKAKKVGTALQPSGHGLRVTWVVLLVLVRSLRTLWSVPCRALYVQSKR